MALLSIVVVRSMHVTTVSTHHALKPGHQCVLGIIARQHSRRWCHVGATLVPRWLPLVSVTWDVCGLGDLGGAAGQQDRASCHRKGLAFLADGAGLTSVGGHDAAVTHWPCMALMCQLPYLKLAWHGTRLIKSSPMQMSLDCNSAARAESSYRTLLSVATISAARCSRRRESGHLASYSAPEWPAVATTGQGHNSENHLFSGGRHSNKIYFSISTLGSTDAMRLPCVW